WPFKNKTTGSFSRVRARGLLLTSCRVAATYHAFRTNMSTSDDRITMNPALRSGCRRSGKCLCGYNIHIIYMGPEAFTSACPSVLFGPARTRTLSGGAYSLAQAVPVFRKHRRPRQHDARGRTAVCCAARPGLTDAPARTRAGHDTASPALTRRHSHARRRSTLRARTPDTRPGFAHRAGHRRAASRPERNADSRDVAKRGASGS